MHYSKYFIQKQIFFFSFTLYLHFLPFFNLYFVIKLCSHNLIHSGTLNKYLSRSIFILSFILLFLTTSLFFVIAQVPRKPWNVSERSFITRNLYDSTSITVYHDDKCCFWNEDFLPSFIKNITVLWFTNSMIPHQRFMDIQYKLLTIIFSECIMPIIT